MKHNLLIINGSRHGNAGQSALICRHLMATYAERFNIQELILNRQKNKTIWRKKIKQAHCFIFISGTYWDSWSASLQYFFEEATAWEATDLWLGKTAAVIISEHSTGGKHVLSTMQGVLNTLGLMITPLGGVIISKNNTMLARQRLKNKLSGDLDDFWGPDDLATLMHNLWQTTVVSADLNIAWRTWRCDRKDFSKAWLTQKDFKN